jgi:HEAT repeat protein
MGIFDVFGVNIEKLTMNKDIDGLIKALRNKQTLIREKAAKALGELKAVRSIESLMYSLNDPMLEVRTAVFQALTELKDDSNHKIIGQAFAVALNDQNEDIRVKAVKMLGTLKGSHTTDPLIGALKDRAKEVRQAAVAALDDTGWQPAHDEVGAIYWSLKQRYDKCVELGYVAVQQLLLMLSDDNQEVRKQASICLKEICVKNVEGEPLVIVVDFFIKEAQKNQDESIGSSFTAQLVHINGKQTMEISGAKITCPKTSSDNDPRWPVINLLRESGSPAITALIAAYKTSDDKVVRKNLVWALSEMGLAAIEPLLKILRLTNEVIDGKPFAIIGHILSVKDKSKNMTEYINAIAQRIVEEFPALREEVTVEKLMGGCKEFNF